MRARAKSTRAKRIMRDILLWAVDNRVCDDPEPVNLLVVSNNILGETELVSVLKALEST